MDSDWRISLDHHRVLAELADIIVDALANYHAQDVRSMSSGNASKIALLLACWSSVLQ